MLLSLLQRMSEAHFENCTWCWSYTIGKL